jgi:dipeptidyl aminopeptidase/acylaminoacyl peptidase
MNLQSGTVLGHYEIRGLLGRGGMGEVYRAWDARLRREIAIKILLPGGASDSGRLQRFEHEARAAGALNHPNITAVYDIGTHEGVPFIVSERLEGGTLRGRIDSGTLTPAKAIEYGIQIARGLSAAHERGIIHRDLKPENVFVCGDGVVKILDFGVAKLRDEEDRRGAETMTLHTESGTIVGTAAYMSPEQLRGAPIDARADIFSLGVVLYEMLAGRRPFAGDTISELYSAILRDDPAPLPPRVRGVERVIRRCLEKRPEDRFDTARDVSHALEAASLTDDRPSAVPEEAGPARWLSTAALVAATLVVGGIAGAAISGYLRGAIEPPLYTQLTFQRGTVMGARFAPDGQTVVYSAAWGAEPPRVFTTRIGSTQSRDLGIEGHVWSVSPNGDLAVRLNASRLTGAPGTLARVSLAGGPPREVDYNVAAADWDAEGELAVLKRVDGQSIIEYPRGTVVYRSPGEINTMCLLPDRRVAVFEHLKDGGDRPGVLALVNPDGSRQVLSAGWTDWIGAPVVWSPSLDEVLFASFTDGAAALHAATLSGRTRVVGRVPGDFQIRDVDRQGRMLMVSNVPRGGVMLLEDRESEERDVSWLDFSYVVDLSSDGKHILLGDISGGLPGGGVAIRRTDGPQAIELGRGTPLALAPDADRVLALKSDAGSDSLLVIPTGAGQPRELRHASVPRFFEATWLPDGDGLVIVGGPDSRRSRLYVWDERNSTAPRAVSADGTYGKPVVSPDGLLIAAAREGAALSLYSVDGEEARPLAGATEDDQPLRWSADGKWLFVRAGSGMPAQIDRLEIASGRRENWKQLMPADRTGLFGISGVVITPDGTSYAYTFSSSISTLYLVTFKP